MSEVDDLFDRLKGSSFAAASGDPNQIPQQGALGDGSIAGTGWVSNSEATVVIDASGISVTDGKITVTNPGSVVVIDGTSDMFKIAASGSLTCAFPAAGNTATSDVSLTGLGSAYTVTPPVISMVTPDNSSAVDGRRSGVVFAVNAATGVMHYFANTQIFLTSGVVQVQLRAASIVSNPGTTAATRYYVLAEAGI